MPATVYPGVLNVRDGSPLVLPAYWGRVRWLQDEGAFVERGDKVLELYNPSLERQKIRNRENRRRAQADFVLAAENGGPLP